MTTNPHPQNPFALLRISTQATVQAVVEHSKELIEDTYDAELKNAYTKAVEQIIHHPFARLVTTVWEMPNTNYAEHDEAWQKFVRAFQSNPTLVKNLNEQADMFIKENFHPDKLLILLSPLLKISRPGKKHIFTLSVPPSSDLRKQLDSSELF
jgi:hypothetical protein